MASVTRGKDEQKSAGGEGAPAAERESQADADSATGDVVKVPAAAPAAKDTTLGYRRKDEKSRKRNSVGAFFTVYKRGQGYWTRMGTVIGAGILGLMLGYTIFDQVGAAYKDKKLGAEWAVGFLAVYSAVSWFYMNKPSNVDFLIATDSEMKKVNWTSRKELMGSTRVVILFMFLIALFLFMVDEAWGWLMYLFHVLKVKPFGT